MKLAPGVVITREQESILKLIPEYKLISFEKRSQLKLNRLYVIIGGLRSAFLICARILINVDFFSGRCVKKYCRNPHFYGIVPFADK